MIIKTFLRRHSHDFREIEFLSSSLMFVNYTEVVRAPFLNLNIFRQQHTDKLCLIASLERILTV